MDRERCGRCGRDLGASREGVSYCDSCIRLAKMAGSGGLWRATLLTLLLLVVVGFILALVAPSLNELLDGTGRQVVGFSLTLVPSILWLLFFYSQDRLEPEPHHYVLGVFILGGLLGGSVHQPLLRDFFQIQRWATTGTLLDLFSQVLLTGMLTASLIYFAVRFTVMLTDEFDERVDGIIYGTAAALGLGVAANLNYLIENGTISLGIGTLQIIVTSLAYASFGAILGYFLGLIRPGGVSPWLAPIAVLLVGMIHGLYEWVANLLGTGGIGYNPWPTLILTTLFTVAAFGLVYTLIHRAYQAMVIVPAEEGGANG